MMTYKKAGEKMTLVHILREMTDMLTHDMEGEEVVNCYNNIMMDDIEYLGESEPYSILEFRKVKDGYGGEIRRTDA